MIFEEIVPEIAMQAQKYINELVVKHLDTDKVRFVILHDIKTKIAQMYHRPAYEFLLIPKISDFYSALKFQIKKNNFNLFYVENEENKANFANEAGFIAILNFNPNTFLSPEEKTANTKNILQNYYILPSIYGIEKALISTKKLNKKFETGNNKLIFDVSNSLLKTNPVSYFTGSCAEIVYFRLNIPDLNEIPAIIWFNFDRHNTSNFMPELYKKLLELEKHTNLAQSQILINLLALMNKKESL